MRSTTFYGGFAWLVIIILASVFLGSLLGILPGLFTLIMKLCFGGIIVLCAMALIKGVKKDEPETPEDSLEEPKS